MAQQPPPGQYPGFIPGQGPPPGFQAAGYPPQGYPPQQYGQGPPPQQYPPGQYPQQGPPGQGFPPQGYYPPQQFPGGPPQQQMYEPWAGDLRLNHTWEWCDNIVSAYIITQNGNPDGYRLDQQIHASAGCIQCLKTTDVVTAPICDPLISRLMASIPVVGGCEAQIRKAIRTVVDLYFAKEEAAPRAFKDKSGQVVFSTGFQIACCGVGARPGNKVEGKGADVELADAASAAVAVGQGAATGASSSGAEAAGAAVASAATASSAGGAVNALASADPGAIWECIGYNPYTLDGQGNLEGFVLEAGLLDKIRDYFNLMFCLASGPGPLVGVITDANKKTVLEVRTAPQGCVTGCCKSKGGCCSCCNCPDMYQETLLFFRPNAYMPADVVAHAEWNIPLMPCGSGYKKGWVILKTPIKPMTPAERHLAALWAMQRDNNVWVPIMRGCVCGGSETLSSR